MVWFLIYMVWFLIYISKVFMETFSCCRYQLNNIHKDTNMIFSLKVRSGKCTLSFTGAVFYNWQIFHNVALHKLSIKLLIQTRF